MKILDIAKECGADVQQEVNTSDKVYNLINVLNITEAQLIATLEAWNRQNSEAEPPASQDTITIPSAEYAKLKEDAELLMA